MNTCHHCGGICINRGRRAGAQVLYCKTCGRYHQATYRYKAWATGMDERITTCVKEGCGIRSIGRMLGISPTTVIARIRRIASGLGPGSIPKGRKYEVDELATYIRNKKNRVWVAYALDKKDRRVVALRVGARSKRMLRPLVDTLLLANAKHIGTDGLDLYRYLVPTELHHVKGFGINRIERHNLTLRTQLKRLARRTICYTKSLDLLYACVAIHCWG